MVKPKIGFVVYGVHKDGLQDPMGQPFIDEALVANAKNALQSAGVELVVEDSGHCLQARGPGVLLQIQENG